MTARMRFARKLRLSMNVGQFNRHFLDDLEESLRPWRSSGSEQGMPVLLNYARADAQGDIELGANWRVKPADEMLHALKHKLGNRNVALLYE